MRSGKYPLIFITIFLFIDLLSSQTFTNATAQLPTSIPTAAYIHMAIADMNQDGRPDIVRSDDLGFHYILQQQNDGSFLAQNVGKIQNGYPECIIVGDVNNDLLPDILSGSKFQGIKLVLSPDYHAFRLPQDSIFAQGAAFCDFNNDGLLDIFVCNDVGTSAIWRNEGNEIFTRQTMGFDLNTVPVSTNAGNYGVVCVDVNQDHHMDLYISKCSGAALNDSLDPRRINQLYIHQSNGSFLEESKIRNVADSSQTWVTEFQDIDNDGDLDMFIANHQWPSRLLLNNGAGTFQDVTAQSGLLGQVPDGILQAAMQDFDNDGYMDILVGGRGGSRYFKNNGNATFSSVSLPLTDPTGTTPLVAFVYGDINQDGFQDIYASYNYANTEPDMLWLNTPNTNHFLRIQLEGTVSNKNSVGAHIRAIVGNQTLIREVRAGESYGISNDFTQIIGLGGARVIDYLFVRWPSGREVVLTNVNANQTLELVEPLEGGCCSTIKVKKGP